MDDDDAAEGGESASDDHIPQREEGPRTRKKKSEWGSVDTEHGLVDLCADGHEHDALDAAERISSVLESGGVELVGEEGRTGHRESEEVSEVLVVDVGLRETIGARNQIVEVASNGFENEEIILTAETDPIDASSDVIIQICDELIRWVFDSGEVQEETMPDVKESSAVWWGVFERVGNNELKREVGETLVNGKLCLRITNNCTTRLRRGQVKRNLEVTEQIRARFGCRIGNSLVDPESGTVSRHAAQGILLHRTDIVGLTSTGLRSEKPSELERVALDIVS